MKAEMTHIIIDLVEIMQRKFTWLGNLKIFGDYLEAVSEKL
jgi:hypothetical protein